MPTPNELRFGECRYDLARQSLSRNGEPVQKDDKITLLRVIANLNANTFEVVASPMAPEFEAGSMDFSRLPLASGNYRLRFAVTDYRERNAFSTPYDYP